MRDRQYLHVQARLVRALKRLTIDRPPNVLVFQLKRFEYMFHGSKITKKVQRALPLLSAASQLGMRLICSILLWSCSASCENQDPDEGAASLRPCVYWNDIKVYPSS